MRILIVASEAPPVVSGVARSVGEIAAGLQARGHEVRVISSAEAAGVRWDRLRLSTVGVRLVSAIRDDEPYDVVNVHGPSPTISDLSLLRLLAPRNSPPVVYTHHFALHFGLAGVDLVAAGYDATLRAVARRCAAVVTTTESYAREFARISERVHVIPWGVDQIARPGSPSTYDGSEPLRVLSVGQFRRYKGMAIAVRAALGCPEVQLSLVGDGPVFDSVRSNVPAGTTNISFEGRLSDDDLEVLYRRSDVILLPSRTKLEAFGIVLLEGMIRGCVPVASNLPGVSDVVGDVGLLAPPGDANALRAVLRALAATPDDVRARSRRAIERARDFTWARTVDGYELLFDKVRSKPAVP